MPGEGTRQPGGPETVDKGANSLGECGPAPRLVLAWNSRLWSP